MASIACLRVQNCAHFRRKKQKQKERKKFRLGLLVLLYGLFDALLGRGRLGRLELEFEVLTGRPMAGQVVEDFDVSIARHRQELVVVGEAQLVHAIGAHLLHRFVAVCAQRVEEVKHLAHADRQRVGVGRQRDQRRTARRQSTRCQDFRFLSSLVFD